jgi:hypothetical protein
VRLGLADIAPLPRGRIAYRVRRRGWLVETIDEDNLVVALGSTVLANALGGAGAGGVLTQFAVGTNLLAPADGNTVLTASYSKAFDSVTYPAPGQVAFAFSLGSGEANGMQIGELGMLTASGLLFSRKVRQAALPKDSTVSLSGVWTISW